MHGTSAKASVRIASLLLERELSGTTIPLALFDASGWDEESFRSLPESLLSIDAIVLCVVRPREDGKLSWMVALKGIGGEAELFKAIRQEALPAIKGKVRGETPALARRSIRIRPKKETFLSIVGAIFRPGWYMDLTRTGKKKKHQDPLFRLRGSFVFDTGNLDWRQLIGKAVAVMGFFLVVYAITLFFIKDHYQMIVHGSLSTSGSQALPCSSF